MTDKKVDIESVAAALETWIEAVGRHDAEAVAALYVEDAVLLPTFSAQIRADREARLDYFRYFTKLPEIRGKITERHLRLFGEIASAEGLYTFTYRQETREIAQKARFSFVFIWSNEKGTWQIAYHHSSALPE